MYRGQPDPPAEWRGGARPKTTNPPHCTWWCIAPAVLGMARAMIPLPFPSLLKIPYFYP